MTKRLRRNPSGPIPFFPVLFSRLIWILRGSADDGWTPPPPHQAAELFSQGTLDGQTIEVDGDGAWRVAVLGGGGRTGRLVEEEEQPVGGVTLTDLRSSGWLKVFKGLQCLRS